MKVGIKKITTSITITLEDGTEFSLLRAIEETFPDSDHQTGMALSVNANEEAHLIIGEALEHVITALEGVQQATSEENKPKGWLN